MFAIEPDIVSDMHTFFISIIPNMFSSYAWYWTEKEGTRYFSSHEADREIDVGRGIPLSPTRM